MNKIDLTLMELTLTLLKKPCIPYSVHNAFHFSHSFSLYMELLSEQPTSNSKVVTAVANPSRVVLRRASLVRYTKFETLGVVMVPVERHRMERDTMSLSVFCRMTS